MAYADLFSDARFYYSFDNHADPITDGTESSKNNPGLAVFAEDSPPGLGSTHSKIIKAQTYPDVINRPGYSDYSGGKFSSVPGIKIAKTVMYWYKYDVPEGATTAGADTLPLSGSVVTSVPSLFYNDNVSNSFNHGLIKNTSEDNLQNAPKEAFTAQTNIGSGVISGGTGPTRTAFYPGIWYHITQVSFLTDSGYTNADGDVYPGSICQLTYVDGSLVFQYWYDTKSIVEIARPDMSDFKVGHSTETPVAGLEKKMAHIALWSEALSVERIREIAWYGRPEADPVQTVLDSNPIYFTTLDNFDPTVAPTVYGTKALEWGPFDGNHPTKIDTTTDGIVEKGWKIISPVNGGGVSVLGGAGLASGMQELHRNRSWSFEFWFKAVPTIPGNPASSGQPFLFDDGSIANGSSIFGLSLSQSGMAASKAVPQIGLPARSSATAYYMNKTPGSPSGLETYEGTTTPDYKAINEINSDFPNYDEGYQDGKWHHVVFTMDPNSSYTLAAPYPFGYIYIDGGSAGYLYNTFEAANGFIDGLVSDALEYKSGSTFNSTTYPVPDISIDNFAVYDRKLTAQEISLHFSSYKNASSPVTPGTLYHWDGSAWQLPTGQKVWDGTAWIDWSKSYWDGTQWVNL